MTPLNLMSCYLTHHCSEARGIFATYRLVIIPPVVGFVALLLCKYKKDTKEYERKRHETNKTSCNKQENKITLWSPLPPTLPHNCRDLLLCRHRCRYRRLRHDQCPPPLLVPSASTSSRTCPDVGDHRHGRRPCPHPRKHRQSRNDPDQSLVSHSRV